MAYGVSPPSTATSLKSGLAGCVERNWRMHARVGGANGVAECRPMPCMMVSPSGDAAWGLAAQRERLAVMAWIASSGERLCVSIWAARFTAHALVLAPPPPSSATPRCRAAVNEWSRCIGGM